RNRKGRLGGRPFRCAGTCCLVLAATFVAVDLSVVDVLLRSCAPDRTGVGPNDVRVTVMVGGHPHVVAEEPGLEWIVGGDEVRHGAGRHPVVIVGRTCRTGVPDLHCGDVVTAGHLAVAVVAIVVGNPGAAAVV